MDCFERLRQSLKENSPNSPETVLIVSDIDGMVNSLCKKINQLERRGDTYADITTAFRKHARDWAELLDKEEVDEDLANAILYQTCYLLKQANRSRKIQQLNELDDVLGKICDECPKMLVDSVESKSLGSVRSIVEETRQYYDMEWHKEEAIKAEKALMALYMKAS